MHSPLYAGGNVALVLSKIAKALAVAATTVAVARDVTTAACEDVNRWIEVFVLC